MFLGLFAELRKATIRSFMSVCLSIRPSECNYSVPIGRIFIKFDICIIFFKYIEKIQVSLKSYKYNGYFT